MFFALVAVALSSLASALPNPYYRHRFDAEDMDDKLSYVVNSQNWNKSYHPARNPTASYFDAEDIDDCILLADGRSIVVARPGMKGVTPKLHFAAEDADDRIHPGTIVRIANQVHRNGWAHAFDAEDMDDCWIGTDGKIHSVNRPGFDGCAAPSRNEAEDVDDKFKIGKIISTAGKIAKIGKFLGYDAEDMDDIAVSTACAIIGAACALTNTGLSIYDRVKGDDESEALSFSAEDSDDKFRINLHEITKVAGQIGQIGQILGYDTEIDFSKYPRGLATYETVMEQRKKNKQRNRFRFYQSSA